VPETDPPEPAFSPLARLRFDLACLEFVERWERERDATVEVPAPRGKRNPTVPKPKHSPEQLLAWLGIDADELSERRAAADPFVEAMADQILSGQAEWLLGAAASTTDGEKPDTEDQE
jgi:hypothetical protein